MLTRDNELNIDFGLNVTFNGKNYQMVMSHCCDEYPIGGLICEYMRLAPTDLKDIIMNIDGIRENLTAESFTEAMIKLHTKMNEELPPVISTMVALDFMNTAEDWFKAVRENRIDEYLEIVNAGQYDSIKEFILSDTGYEEIGGETVLQLLLMCYMNFAGNYVLTKHTFNQIIEYSDVPTEAQEKALEALMAMYGTFIDAQHIDYRIIFDGGDFKDLYTIKSSFSLLLFEMAHIFNSEGTIVKCKNCGHYFVPAGRSDTVYCSYPLRDNKDKTCRDVGAQITRSNKEKNDVTTREYRKVYMRYKMTKNRHPGDREASRKFDELTSSIKDWRKKLSSGVVTSDEFLEWLGKF